MSYIFDIHKAVQATAVLLSGSAGDRMNYLKLLKLLYIADRESIAETGRPITGDRLVAMDHGPLPSRVYNLLKGHVMEGSIVWADYFEKENAMLRLKQSPGDSQLSDFETAKLEEVRERYRDADQWVVRDLTHDFEEWMQNYTPETSREIPLEDILEAVGRGDDIEEILTEASEAKYFDKVFGDC